MQEKFLREVVSFVVGKQSEEIVPLLSKNKHVNEFLIAKKMDITVNQVRNILYKLSDSGLVSHTRKKDEKKGWYTYFWKIENLKSLIFWKNILQKRIDQILNQIKSREVKVFYICEKCNIEVNEENALAYNFSCPECGNVFSLRDNVKVLKELRKNLSKFENQLNLLEKEIKTESEKVEKRKEKEIEKKKKEKKKARKKKREKKKISKKPKTSKKTSKKKKSLKKKTKKSKTKKTSKKRSLKKPRKNELLL